MLQLYEIISFENIGNIGISAITNIGVSAYRQKCHIGTPLIETQMVFQCDPMDFTSWYNPSQAYTVKHVLYPRLTATHWVERNVSIWAKGAQNGSRGVLYQLWANGSQSGPK